MKEKDINIKILDYVLNCRAVSIIVDNDRVLFQKRKNDKFWALPGGKIRVGEKTIETLSRELVEELGIKKFIIDKASFVSECFFSFGGEKVHQYIFGYKVYVDRDEWIFKDDEFEGIEEDKNLIFRWFSINELENVPIKPDFLREQLSKNKLEGLQFISCKEEN